MDTSALRQVPEKVSTYTVSASCALCNCCGACSMFCVTATFWAYYDKNGVGVITQKSVFLGFSITYILIALCVGTSIVAALLLMKSQRSRVDMFIGGIENSIAKLATMPARGHGITEVVQRKLKAMPEDKIISSVEKMDTSWVRRSLVGSWDGIVSALTHHITILAVLVICCIVSFALCWQRNDMKPICIIDTPHLYIRENPTRRNIIT